MSTESSTREWSNRARRWWWSSVRPAWLRIQWPLIWTAAIVALVLGYNGFRLYYLAQGKPRTTYDLIYATIQLFVMESGNVDPPLNRQLEFARFLAPAVTIYTATKAFLTLFRDQLVGVRLWSYRKHIVIAGLGKMGVLLTRTLRRKGWRVVVLERDPHNEKIGHCRETGAVVLIGNASDKALLRKARAHRAEYLISVVGDDGANAEVATQARDLVRETPESKLTCLIHIVEPQLRNLLSGRQLATASGNAFRLEFFNIFQLGARAALKAHPPFGNDVANTSDQPHLLVVGLGRMGQSLIAYAAGEWYQMHNQRPSPLRITVVDRHANEKIKSLRFSHPQVNLIAEFIPEELDVFSAEFKRGAFLFDADGKCPITQAYVCLDNDAAGLYAGLSLLQRLGQRNVSVIVRMTNDAGLATLIRKPETAYHAEKLHSFNLLNQTCDERLLPSGTIETLSAAIHGDYIRRRTSEGQTVQSNPSIAPWDELPETLRESNRLQAQHIGTKLSAIGCGIEEVAHEQKTPVQFSAEEIETMAEMEHARWTDDYFKAGWQLGPGPKDLEKKIHPYLVPWSDLPEDQREIDRETVRAIPELLNRVGLRPYRLN